MQSTLRNIEGEAGHIAVLAQLEAEKQSASDSAECDIIKLSDFYDKIEERASFGDEWPVIEGKPLALKCDAFNQLSELEKQNTVNPQIEMVELINQAPKLRVNGFHDISKCKDVQSAVERRVKKSHGEFQTILLCKDIEGRTEIPHGVQIYLAAQDVVLHNRNDSSDGMDDIPLVPWSDAEEPNMNEDKKSNQKADASLNDVISAIRDTGKAHTDTHERTTKIMGNIAEALSNFSKHEKHLETLTQNFILVSTEATERYDQASKTFEQYAELANSQRAEIDKKATKYFWGSVFIGGAGLAIALMPHIANRFNVDPVESSSSVSSPDAVVEPLEP